jgi:hypothetical protein
MWSHEVILTRITHPRDSIVLEADCSQPCELVEAAATLVSLKGKWDEGPARRKSSEGSFEIEMHRDELVRLAHIHFYEKTPGEPEPRWVPVYGPDEAEDLLAVAKRLAARHAELNLLQRGFDPNHELILTLSHGRFHADLFEYVQVLSNGRNHWPTYSAALYADEKILWSPDGEGMCQNVLDQLNEGGEEWLSNYLTARGLPLPRESDLLDFQKTLVECVLRCRALWDRGQQRWYEENKERLGRTPVTEKADLERKSLAKLACGDIRGSVWLNQSKKEDYLSVSIARIYKTPDRTRKKTHFYTLEDLSDLSELVLAARKFIQEESPKLESKQQTKIQRVRITR